jgi:hypothetical protein
MQPKWRIRFIVSHSREVAMPRKEEPLKPHDFPVEANNQTIVRNNGKPLAEVCDEKTARDVAERLNEHEYQRELDRWSA